MPQTPREIVKRCLTFNHPERIPRDLWILPWAELHHPEAVAEITARFPNDIIKSQYEYPTSSNMKGDRYKVGYYSDEWGCVFKNIQEGIIGEIETPILPDISDWRRVEPPYEQLSVDRKQACDIINRHHGETDRFVIANSFPRPWERYQFLRGTENAMIDVLMQGKDAKGLLMKIHDFYLKELEFWLQSDVDAVWFMDDWGAQNQLLISPALWRDMFKPLYKDYCDFAHAHGKFILMHCDGYITDIFEDLIEIGVDAVNSQLFCMDFSDLKRIARGKITFWGEIDRQHVLPSSDPQVGRDAVRKVASHLYDPAGGIITQFEFSLGTNPETVIAVLDEWDRIGLG